MTPDRMDTPKAGSKPPTTQWAGLDEYAGNPEFGEAMQDEFAEGASEFTDEVSRRRFLTLMGASLALAGAAGCNLRPAPQRKIVPYTTQPDQITPGIPLFFATAAPLGGYGSGVLVRSHEGRPIKIEGNIDHPSSRGGASLFSLASVLDLYDPDRSRAVTHRGLPSTYDLALAAVRKQLYSAAGQPNKAAKLRILTETVTSPTLAAQMTKFLAEFPDAKWVQHDPASRENVHEGTRRAFGSVRNVTYDFTKADVVLSLDADFLCSGPGSVRYSKDFATRRKVRRDAKDGGTPAKMSRLYVAESMPSNTGSVADHRLAIPSSLVESFARALASELKVPGVPAGGALPDAAKAWIKPLADDLLYEKDESGKQKDRPKGSTLVVVGEHQPASLHALAHAINSLLGNFGKTAFLSEAVEVRPDEKRSINLKKLTEEMNAGQVEALLIFSSNPKYTSPADIAFTDEAMKKVGFKLHLGTHQDETAVLCEWHVPETHYLETWGDIRGHDGTASIQQPLIAPLYNGKSIIEFLADVLRKPNEPNEGYDIVRGYWRERFTAEKRSGAFDVIWQEAVRAGIVPDTTPKPETLPLAANWAADASPAPSAPGSADLEINFRIDPTVHDGRFANNGWLQECPKPLTKMTWDNAVYMSPNTAKKLDVQKTFRWTAGEHGRAEVSVVELKLGDRKVMAPAWILPGHPDGVVTVHLGYGRTRAGKVASTPNEPNAAGAPIRGFDAYTLRTSNALWFTSGLNATITRKTYFLACTQGQWRTTQRDPITGMEMDRMPVRHGSLALFKEDPAFARIPPMAASETHEINDNVPAPRREHSQDEKEHGHDSRLKELTMYAPTETLSPGLNPAPRRRWAMAIDLSACTGCSACVIACVGENNTPVIGKYEVTRGRAMHWINIDRYYDGSIENSAELETLFQPRMCVQCENAPCEVVCPVGATVHSSDGLNDMAYNRCVGTRYCSNNCPYKVRRFNFLTFADWATDTLKLGRNPDVSVRSRGVMEKCTFCVQRIRGAEIVAERELAQGIRKLPDEAQGGGLIRDGEVLTACQSACPSDAIMFGDLNDEKSVVARWKNEPTNYGLLAELNTRPRLTYLAVLRNPNPAMPKGA